MKKLLAFAILVLINTAALNPSANAACVLAVRDNIKNYAESYYDSGRYNFSADQIAEAKAFNAVKIIADRNYNIVPETNIDATLGVEFTTQISSFKNIFGAEIYKFSYEIVYYKGGQQVKVTTVPNLRSISQYLLDDFTELGCTL